MLLKILIKIQIELVDLRLQVVSQFSYNIFKLIKTYLNSENKR